MKNLLIKMAYKILSHYGMETMPVIYFNGTRYNIRSYNYHHIPDENVNDTLTIIAEDGQIGPLVRDE